MQPKFISLRRNSLAEPTRIRLPNISLDYGRRKKLSSLVPAYVDPQGFDATEIPPEIYFVHMVVAIELSKDKWLKEVLSQYPKDIPLRDESTGTNLLHVAAKSCTESTLTILLENYKISRLLNESDIRGTTPLIVAAWHGNFAALKYFLALGCETTSIIYDTRKNALHCAADLDDPQLCSQLIKYNSKQSFIDAIDDEGKTPLMIAVCAGSPCVNVLLMAGANYKYQNNQTGRNILHLAILFFQNDMLIKLVKIFSETKIISAVDFNGDTPFMLAIRLKNYACMKILIDHISVNKLLTNSKNCIHYLIKHDDTDILSILISTAKNTDFLQWIDDKGRTPLMYAVETKRLNVVSDILTRQKSLLYRNPNNGETVLHVAAYANDAEIMKLLLNTKGVDDIIDITDYGGRTAFEIALSRSDQPCYYVLRQSGLISPLFFNSHKESQLFIAAKKGNYSVVLNLLLSEKFISFHKKYVEFSKSDLIRAELQGRIYSSDVYIICGDTLNQTWNRAPDQTHLFEHNQENQNIFHACVMGQNLVCLIFMYNYCMRFNDHWRELDIPDMYGSTPLLYAFISGQESVGRFLVQQGANLIFTNLQGEYPLKEMLEHIPQYREFIVGMINECVVKDPSKKRMGIYSGEITISYHILCPTGLTQMEVLKKIFDLFDKREENFDLLQNPVLEYFIEIKWIKLKRVIDIRLYVNILFLLYGYICISLTIWWPSAPKFLILFLQIPTAMLAIISIFINVPHLFVKSFGKKLFASSTFLSPLFTLIYIFLHLNDANLRWEIGSLAILTSAVSVFIHAIDTPLGQQISMFHEVLFSIISHLPLGIILLISFSLCFFILFHESPFFSDPYNSFLFTVMVLLDGNSDSYPTFERRREGYNLSSNDVTSNQKEFRLVNSLVTQLIEGILLITFKLFITLALLNMLIGLSVRDASELEKGGKVQRSRTKVDVLWKWETFSHSKFYKWLSKYHLVFIFGLKSNLIDVLTIPPVIYPLENPVKSFDMNRLQNIAMQKEDRTSVYINYLSEDIGYYEQSNPENNELIFQ